MFALEVAFLTGRYVATAFDDRSRAEWPPHPARVFSALVATHAESQEPPASEREALEWLERQGAPTIVASEASVREVVTVYVPVNDPSVVGSLDDELEARERARAEAEAARAKGGKAVAQAEKKLAKADERYREAVRKALAAPAPGKEGKGGPALAESLLPERRTRQPRTFPSVTPEDPRVVLVWPDAAPTAQHRGTLDAIAGRVVRLGHSSSLVTMRVRDDAPAPTWVPEAGEAERRTTDGVVLRIASPGQLEALDATFALQADAPGRVMPASFRRYGRPALAEDARVASSVFGDWIVLRRIDGPRLPSWRAVDVARTLRRALLESFGPEAPEILSGHRAPSEPSLRPHLAFVPLPFVGSEHADGSILGVAIVLPRSADPEARRAVFGAVRAWEDRWRRADEDSPRVPLFLGRAGELGLSYVEEATQSTLRPSTWTGPSRRWTTATPVALDRNPGDLRSRDAKKEAAAYAEAEAIVAASCEHVGLPTPARVTVLPAAPIAGAAKARQFPPFSTGKPPVQRVLVHASISFAEPVAGPVLLGAGRYFGLGLFRPVGDHE